MRTLARLCCAVLVAGLGLAFAVVLLAPQIRAFLTAGSAGPDQEVDLRPLAVPSIVYAADGSELDLFVAEENRVPIPLDQVPEHVVRAVLDAEDERFFDHGPLDLRAMVRALVENVESGGISQGGSTITQQLVKTALLTPEQHVGRKIQEAALAIRLENQMSKHEILERYLNTVYFGNGQYGIEAAAQLYFQAPAADLSLGQGILLASLIRNPVGGDPWVYPEEAIGRRDVVIERMAALGHVPADQVEELKGEPLPEPPPERPAQGSDYFVEYAKQTLLADERLGATQQDRVQALFKGGLKIHTTLDPNAQRIAEEQVARIVPDTGGQFGAALVSVEPATGAVRALVGGAGFERSKFNLVTDGQGRQTGSSFKTFTLAAALEAGYLPNDVISGAYPCRIPDPDSVEGIWEPRNVEGSLGGSMTLTDATVSSVNCAYARLVKLVGPQRVADVAKRLGVMEPLPPLLSITLGALDTTPLSMASAYATLAADGERRPPYVVERVEDRNGKVILKAEPKAERAISVQNARTITQVLTQVVSRGTGTAAQIPGWTAGVAGKTGSADNNLNAWFVGYTPQLSTAVWMGTPGTLQRPMTNVGGVTVYGGTYPAMIWGAYMRALEAGKPPQRFTPPEVLTTRAPRTLVLPGELPPVFPQQPTLVFDDQRSTATTAPSSVTVPPIAAPVDPTVPTVPVITAPTITFPFDDDDDTSRTTRTTRQPRPRDLTTLPPAADP
jgi:penicillin-binding protein 1A